MNPKLPFSEAEFVTANQEWGCNCGPATLAFALQITLDQVRPAIPDFENKHYTAPNMMRAGIEYLGRKYQVDKPVSKDRMAIHPMAIVRVQWGGPWLKPEANPKWRYWYTHWIAAGLWYEASIDRDDKSVFDCNGGRRSLKSWEEEIVPYLTERDKRCDGAWFPTHIWRIL